MAEGSGAHRHRGEWASITKQDLGPHVKTRKSWTPRNPFGRVGSRLRELRREQFVPELVFLGLYQRSSYNRSHQRSRGNIFKVAVAGAFLADSGKAVDDWEEISASIVKDPQAVLDMYNEDGLDDFSTEDARSVLSLDAIFSAWFSILLVRDAPLSAALFSQFLSVYSVLLGIDRTFAAVVVRDMLKLENQIPLELVRNALVLFFKILKQNFENQTLTSIARSLLASSASCGDIGDAETQADQLLQHICARVAATCDNILPGSISTKSFSDLRAQVNLNNCEHFLHCVYLNMISEGPEHGTRAVFKNASADRIGNASDRKSGDYGNLSHNLPASIQSMEKTFFHNRGSPFASASLLRKAGINFRGKTGLEPQFKKHLLGATLYLPRIPFVGDGTEAIWMNLLAFEATWRRLLASLDEDGFQHPFMSYLVFMAELIDLEEDVALLRHGKNLVIVNVGVESNAEIARIFNSMTTNYLAVSNDKWKSVRGQVTNYYNSKGRRTWVEFRRTNFGKPWLIASFLAAAALLALTLLQTYFTIWPLQFSTSDYVHIVYQNPGS